MKMNRDGVKAVLFDWDFTLAYTLQKDLSHIERTAALFQGEGINYPVEAFQAARHKLLSDVALGRANGAIKPQTKREIIRFYQQLLTRLGHPDTSQELAYRIYMAYGRLPTTLYEDVLPTLQALQKADVKLGILSNHSRSVRQTIERLVGQYIPSRHITVSEEVGVHKPSRTIFRRAAICLHTRPHHCIYVGDNLHVDAIGAVVQGGYGRGIWLDRAGQGTTQDTPANVARILTLQQVLDFVLTP
jgi:HAD superfamily hydrolase (TIGR01549 family)